MGWVAARGLLCRGSTRASGSCSERRVPMITSGSISAEAGAATTRSPSANGLAVEPMYLRWNRCDSTYSGRPRSLSSCDFGFGWVGFRSLQKVVDRSRLRVIVSTIAPYRRATLSTGNPTQTLYIYRVWLMFDCFRKCSGTLEQPPAESQVVHIHGHLGSSRGACPSPVRKRHIDCPW